MQGMPSGRGRKGGRKRVKESTISETFVSVNRFVPPPPSPTPSQPSLPAHCLPPPPQAQQSQLHDSGNVNVASGTASHVTVSLPHSLPPPLIRMDPPGPSQPANVNPFYIKFIVGNIRVCQGCKGSLKTVDNHIPTPPFDIAAARSENKPFRDASGNLITPKRATVYHYHCHPQCIRAVEPHFVLSSLLIPGTSTSETATHEVTLT